MTLTGCTVCFTHKFVEYLESGEYPVVYKLPKDIVNILCMDVSALRSNLPRAYKYQWSSKTRFFAVSRITSATCDILK